MGRVKEKYGGIRRGLALALALLLVTALVSGCGERTPAIQGPDPAGGRDNVPDAGGDTPGGKDAADEDAPGEGAADAGLPSLSEIMDADTRVWSYTDDPARLGLITDASWTAAGFDDSGWLRASGSFGARDGKLEPLAGDFTPEVCLRHYGPEGKAIPTYYFRLVFTAKAGEAAEPVCVQADFDDAVIFYLNGEELASFNTPEGGYPAPNSYGCEDAGSAPNTETLTIGGGLIREGTNVLAAELHQTSAKSSDIYFAFGDMYREGEEPPLDASLQNDTICLGPGRDSSEMLVTWRGPECESAFVQVGVAGDGEFTASYPATAVYPDGETGERTYRAVLTGLGPGDYVYRTWDVTYSKTYSFHVAEERGSFSFLCHGDIQICDEDDREAMDVYQYMAGSVMGGDVPEFILSLGDQTDDGGDMELYRRCTGAALFKSVPLAPVVGNHEKRDEEFSEVFFVPNVDEDTLGDAGDMSGDYWFYRDGVLFLCLNSNNTDVEAHEKFMEEARRICEETWGRPSWTVAALHFSFYSAGEHSADDKIVDGREPYDAAFRAAGVDVVFSGHDHIYTRSYPISGGEPREDGEPGIVYFTLGSSTGTKMNDLYEEGSDYAAFADDGKYPAMTRVDVTDTALEVTTYRDVDGNMEVLDAYTLEKTP